MLMIAGNGDSAYYLKSTVKLPYYNRSVTGQDTGYVFMFLKLNCFTGDYQFLDVTYQYVEQDSVTIILQIQPNYPIQGQQIDYLFSNVAPYLPPISLSFRDYMLRAFIITAQQLMAETFNTSTSNIKIHKYKP